MFDENSGYVRDEVDLMQLIEEPMLKRFDVSNIPSSTVIDDISPDDEITIPSVHQPDNPSNQSKDKGKASNDQEYLPSPNITPASDSGVSTPILTPGESSENSESARAPPPPKSGGIKLKKFAPSAPAPRDISAKVDESNVIPEGVKRARQPRK